jgi:hypothetical protein
MKPIKAEETGAPVAWCIQAERASEKRFDEAFDRASSEFHSTTVDEYETDRSKSWVRFKSKLAWPRTTHPQTPNVKRPDPMPTTATDEKLKAAPEKTAHQELVRRLVERTEYARLPSGITEEEASQLLHTEGEGKMTTEEAREVEALLSTDVGERLATLVEELTFSVAKETMKESA